LATGPGSIADLFRRAAIGQTGAAGIATVNPNSQIFGVAIQLGLAGVGGLEIVRKTLGQHETPKHSLPHCEFLL
jgi:hypothetical protein